LSRPSTGRARQQSERDIVVGAAPAATAVPAAVVVRVIERRRRTVVLPATLLAACQVHDPLGDDLGDPPLLALLVLVAPGLDAALDVELAALGQVLGSVLRVLAPDDDAVPLDLLLPLAVLPLPALVRRDAQLADRLAAGRVPDVRVLAARLPTRMTLLTPLDMTRSYCPPAPSALGRMV
jgi:hypothetical protein